MKEDSRLLETVIQQSLSQQTSAQQSLEEKSPVILAEEKLQSPSSPKKKFIKMDGSKPWHTQTNECTEDSISHYNDWCEENAKVFDIDCQNYIAAIAKLPTNYINPHVNQPLKVEEAKKQADDELVKHIDRAIWEENDIHRNSICVSQLAYQRKIQDIAENRYSIIISLSVRKDGSTIFAVSPPPSAFQAQPTQCCLCACHLLAFRSQRQQLPPFDNNP